MMVWYDLDLETSFKDTLHQRLFVGEVLARLDQGERMNDPDDDFSDNSAMTMHNHSPDLETWFKVTALKIT